MADSAPDPNDAPDEPDEKNVAFPMPEGFEPPKGTKPGDEFEALATLKIDSDGDLCLLKLDGTDVKPEEADPELKENDQSAMDSARQALPSTGLPSGISSL